MSTQFTIDGPSYDVWVENLRKVGFSVINHHDLHGNNLGADIRFGGRNVGRLQRVPFSDYRWQLNIDTGWCRFGLIRQMLENIEASLGL